MEHTPTLRKLLAYIVLAGLPFSASAQNSDKQRPTAQNSDKQPPAAQSSDTQSPSARPGNTRINTRSVNIGLVYPISTNGLNAPQCSNYFSLNAIAGVSRAETGTSIAGLANIVLDQSSGLQLAGLWNITRNRSSGAQIAGLTNMAGGATFQLAGLMNTAGDANIKNADIPLVGPLNSAGKATVQIAGFLNNANDARVQIAGFINIAKRVKGVQLAGFLNIADSSDCPIGLINLIRNGEKSAGLSVDETRTILLSFRSGGRKLYGIVGIGYNGQMHQPESAQTSPEALNLATGEAGVGAHFNFAEAFRVNTELAATISTDFEHGDYQKYIFRLLPSLHFQHFEAYAGPTLNFAKSDKGLGSDLIHHYWWSQNAGSIKFEALFFGAIAGINYRF
jgi:hypothetical protein